MLSVTGPDLSLQVDNRHTTGPPFTAPSRDITTLVEPYIVNWRTRPAIISLQIAVVAAIDRSQNNYLRGAIPLRVLKFNRLSESSDFLIRTPATS